MTDTLTIRPGLKRAIGLLAEGSSAAGPRGIGLTPDEARDLLSALPAELVAAATVEMPKERGLYVGPGGVDGPVDRVPSDGGPLVTAGMGRTVTPAEGPFRRLVAEGDGPALVFTAGELRRAWLGHGVGGINHGGPEWDRLADFVNKTISKEADR